MYTGYTRVARRFKISRYINRCQAKIETLLNLPLKTKSINKEVT